MSILTRLSRYAADYRARRLRARTYLAISALPLEIQKDIGWSLDDEPIRRSDRSRNAAR